MREGPKRELWGFGPRSGPFSKRIARISFFLYLLSGLTFKAEEERAITILKDKTNIDNLSSNASSGVVQHGGPLRNGTNFKGIF